MAAPLGIWTIAEKFSEKVKMVLDMPCFVC